MTSKQRWKQAERETAAAFGTTRVPNNGFGQPDFLVPPTTTRPALACQVKTRKAMPAWFIDAMSQAELDADNTDGEALPVVVYVLAPGSGIKKKRYVVLRLDDAVQLIGKDGANEQAG